MIEILMVLQHVNNEGLVIDYFNNEYKEIDCVNLFVSVIDKLYNDIDLNQYKTIKDI